MVLFDGVAGLLFLALWIFCIVDVITTPQDQVRNLPKIAWLLLVVILVDAGSVAWLVAGRTWGAKRAAGGMQPTGPQAQQAGQARFRPTNPDDDEEFLATLRARAEEQRRRAREQDGGPDAAPPRPV